MPTRSRRQRVVLVAVAMVVTFVVLRVYLHHSPNSNFDIGSYNVHHLFTGLLLATISVFPLMLFDGPSRTLDAVAILFGVGLSMALDEWVYLIVTDGSDASYLLPVSLWGGVVAVGMGSAYALVLAALAHRRHTGVPTNKTDTN